MMDEIEPYVGEEMAVPRSAHGGESWFVFVLAALWIILPAVQYAGAYQRTLAVAARGADTGALGALDLLPWYIALLGATAIYVVRQALTRHLIQKSTDGKQD
jgi:hypothetical protein